MNALIGPLAPLVRWLTRPPVVKLIGLPALLLLAVFLRFYLVQNQSIWNDEGNSLRMAQRPLLDLIATAKLDIHPPGYYLALSGWIALTGDSEFAMRALSALAGVVTVACVYALGRALFSSGVGFLAGLLVAVNAFSVYYGQEARMYAALAMFAAAAMLVFVRWLHDPANWRTGVALALLNAGGLYTQYSFPAVMVVQGLMFVIWLVAVSRNKPRALAVFIGINLLTIALFLPQLPTALAQVTAWPRTGRPIGLAEGLGTIAQWLIFGNTTLPLPWWVYGWPALFVLVAIFPDWLKRRGGAPPGWWARLLPWIWLAVSIGPFFALGLFREANLKLLLPAEIAAALLIGRGIWLLWEIGSPNIFILVEALPRLAAGIGLIFMLMQARDVLHNLYHDPLFARADYRGIASLIARAPRPGDAVVLDAPNQWEAFSYYYKGAAPVFFLPEGLGGNDAATATSVKSIIARYRRIFVLYWGESERDPNHMVEATLTGSAFQVGAEWRGDVRLVEYATFPAAAGVVFQPAIRFGDSIRLDRIALSGTDIAPGDVLGITFTWSTASPLSQRYKVFVQLLDKDGRLAAPSSDSEPGNNLALTTTWQPGQPVTDARGILVPGSMQPGDYHLIVGVYDINDPSKRLPVGGADHYEIATIRVRGSP